MGAEQEVETVRLRGENGVEYDFDVPPERTQQRELYEEGLRSGRITLVDPDEPRPSDAEDVAAVTGPASVAWDEVGDAPEHLADGPGVEVPVRPARNAGKDDWVEYVVARGFDRDAAVTHGRDELRDLFPEDPED